jgi:biopolymer transport protein TolR
MLVLLVIFMVTSPLQQQGIDIDLPVAKGKPVQSEATPTLIISVKKNGHYYTSENASKPEVISRKNLIKKVTTLFHDKPKLQVYLRGDKAVAYGEMVEVMAALKQSGIVRIGLMTTISDE